MRLFYKDYELHSFALNENGYLVPFCPNFFKFPNYKNEISDYVVKPEDNFEYFSEANILTKVNLNEENYFDFNKAILDIGAHVGCYSFRSNFKYVYAFEPNKIIFSCLNINLLMHNKFNNSKTFNVLLSDKNEEVEYDGYHTYLDDQPNEMFNDYDNSIITYRYNEKVKTHTLDEYNLDNIGLIKIDVEGMEEKVLRGGLGTIIRNNYPPILFELWNINQYGMTEQKHNSLQKFLNDLGYEIIWQWGDSSEFTHLALHK